MAISVAPVAKERTLTRTTDGWSIAVFRYRDRVTRRAPVLLCHGLASCHRSFDLDPDASLALHLAAAGYDVFAVDLRGAGDSRPQTPSRVRRWAFDDYLMRDIPAVLDHVRNLTGRGRVHWIGHSMGGLLGAAHLSVGGSRDLASAVLLGSSLDYSSGTGFARLLPFTSVIGALPFVPVRAVALASAPLAGRTVVSPFERFNVWRPNVDPRLWRLVCETVFYDVSPGVMQQLATALSPGGLTSVDGAVRYLDGLPAATSPVLCIAGDRDPQCPPAAARKTFEAFRNAPRELWVLGSGDGGSSHYGHFDLLIGKRRREEVYPILDRFLARHDVD